jgi:single-strand DNA-binding protein
MTSINKTVLIGNVGNAPEVRYMPSGDPVMNFSVATTHRWKDNKTEEWREVTEWHRVVVFGRIVPELSLQLPKGSQVYIEGRLQTRKWKDANNNDKQVTEIKAEICKLFAKEPSSAIAHPSAPAISEPPDDLPF